MASPRIERVPVPALTARQKDEVWDLAARYTDTTREVFERSLAQKKECVLIRERRSGALVGTGSVDVSDVDREGRRVKVIYSGNLIFSEAVRGQALVERIGFGYFARARLRAPLTPIWLFYDTFSVKSYLMLPRNFATFWPRFDRSTPPWEAALLDDLARRRYGEAWDPARGIVRSAGDRTLKPWVAPVTEALREDPHARFFEEKNPGYRSGDMLAVMTPLDARNWASVARSVARGLGRRRR